MKAEDWLEEWWTMFPADGLVPTDGYLKEKLKDCVKKMQKFCSDNKTITKETIFAATKMYLAEQKAKGYAYTKRPQYFINKLGQGSLLGTYCEKVVAGEQANIKPEEPIYKPQNDFL